MSPPGPVVEGSTVDLVCEAIAGDPPTSFSWTNPDGMEVFPSDTDGNISVTIANGDYGRYTCEGSNEFNGVGTVDVEVVQAGMCMVIVNSIQLLFIVSLLLIYKQFLLT